MMNFVQNTPIFNKITIPSIPFRSNEANCKGLFEPAKDCFNTNPTTDVNTLKQSVQTNPRISEILKEYNIPVKINISELEKLQKGHLMDTRITAAKMYSALPDNLKFEVNLKNLQDAAMFHDYGKVLIPEKILNKEGKLTDKEKEIMQLHSELGYELLKNQGINKEVLNLIKYHHQKPNGNGYPLINNDFTPNISTEILATADKYSALREARSYKPAMSREEALNIIKKDVQAGTISPEVYTALEKSI